MDSIKTKKYKLVFILILVFLAGSCLFGVARSDTTPTDEEKQAQENADNLDQKISDKQEDLESLEQKARNYQRMIDLKRQQQATLQNQLGLMDLQIENFTNGIEISKKDIDSNISQINSIQNQISEIEAQINKTKKDLSELLITYNQIDEEISMEMLSSKGDISTFLNHSEYLDQTSQKVGSVLSEIQQKKNQLKESQQVLEDKNNELQDKKAQLEEKTFLLSNEKNSKKTLLSETQGEEAKYQELLQRVEEQKQELIGDIDSLSSDKQSELAKIKSDAPKPKDGTASLSWYYSQKDPRWGSNRIGLSSSLLKDYGCALTSVAMVFTFHDQKITPGKLAQEPIFYRDLIMWPQYWKGLKLSSSTSHGNISWTTLDKELKAGNPVIVFVRAKGGKGHYVVVHSKDKKNRYVVHDPLFGPNIYLDTTQKLIGAIYNSSTTIDQMIVYH